MMMMKLDLESKKSLKLFKEAVLTGACILTREAWEALPERYKRRKRYNMFVVSTQLYFNYNVISCPHLDTLLRVFTQGYSKVYVFDVNPQPIHH
jgi:hypothetical protein